MSLYYIVKDKKTFKEQQVAANIDDVLQLIGEKPCEHITVGGFAETKNNDIIIEVPDEMEDITKKIKASGFNAKFISKEKAQKLLPEYNDD